MNIYGRADSGRPEIGEMLEEAAIRRRNLPPPKGRRAIRDAAGLTQADFGRLLGVGRATIACYESGAREPRGVLRQEYAALLEELRHA